MLLKDKNREDNGEQLQDEEDSYFHHQSDLIFITRELEHANWISQYIEGILEIPEMTKRMKFHFYFTVKDKSNNLASFLFWRSITQYNLKLTK